MNNNNGLELDGVEIRLGKRCLISITEQVAPGEILTVMGPSGSGKSTLLSFIGGFLDNAFNAKGSVRLGGKEINDLSADDRKVGILFQDALLFPHMSVGGNLLFAIPSSVKGKIQRKEIALKALAQAGLADFFDRDPATLSGGQKARVALMRVLLAEPRALLLDEPFSKLDVDRREDLRRFVFEEAKRKNLPVLLITHDEADASSAGGRVFELTE